MGLRPGFKVIGHTIGSAPFGFMPLPNGRPPMDRHFRCRYCQVTYANAQSGPIIEERDACFAHEALCDQRPGGDLLTDRERDALEAAYGKAIRELIAFIDRGAGALTPDDLAVAKENRGLLTAELVRLGLPETAGTVAWACQAYGPDGVSVGALCFVADPGERRCGTQNECHTLLAAHRVLVFERIRALAASGDPVGQRLAAEFTHPNQLLGGDPPPPEVNP